MRGDWLGAALGAPGFRQPSDMVRIRYALCVLGGQQKRQPKAGC